MKRLLIVMFILLFGISLSACEKNDLNEYKLEAVYEIDNYLNNKRNEELLNQEIILDTISKGKTEINEADDKDSVNNAVTNVKEIIDKLYEEETLLVNQVKQSYLDGFIKINRADATLEDVVIKDYLGIYNGNFVAVLYDKNNSIFKDVSISYKIAYLDFSYSYGYPIFVWKNGECSLLHEAYEQGEITNRNLRDIYYLYHNKHLQQKTS